jgi:hypothetical protein
MSICRFDLSPERVSRQHCAKQIKLLHCAYMSRPRDDMHDGYGVLAIMKSPYVSLTQSMVATVYACSRHLHSLLSIRARACMLFQSTTLLQNEPHVYVRGH